MDFTHRATSSTFLTPITTIAMAEPPPTTDIDHDNEPPKKKKPKHQEKPVPTFLQDLDILNLHECEITSQQISVKGEDCEEYA